jgi:membrane associated rhomboid family serine protease
MSAGPDLFVVCKQCGAEVSAYITECPYCGYRLRRRAPKLPREGSPRRPGRLRRRGQKRLGSLPAPSLGRLRRGEIPGVAAEPRPYATIFLVAASIVVWIIWQGGVIDVNELRVVGPLHGQWWRVVSSQFVYEGSFFGFLYAFAVLGSVGLFGWLLEERHGPAVVLALFFAAGAAGALLALAVYPNDAVVSGANAGALALLCAWAAPDLIAASRGSYYEGDLLGVGAIAAVLLLMPFARPHASWVAGVTGALMGLLVGAGLTRTRSQDF